MSAVMKLNMKYRYFSFFALYITQELCPDNDFHACSTQQEIVCVECVGLGGDWVEHAEAGHDMVMLVSHVNNQVSSHEFP